MCKKDDRYIYVAKSLKQGCEKKVEVYDVILNTWRVLSDLQSDDLAHSMFFIKKYLFVMTNYCLKFERLDNVVFQRSEYICLQKYRRLEI